MKYRTVIELICEGQDTEDAGNLAGEYLKGDVDFGVTMKCKTVSLMSHQIKKYAVLVVAIFIISSSLILKVTPIGVCEKKNGAGYQAFSEISTIGPVLKTKNKVDFMDKWKKSKEKAVLNYLKQ
ncbi:MAG: hypothetical protein ABH844_00175 [Candidatus Omnitrophota bacterium]